MAANIEPALLRASLGANLTSSIVAIVGEQIVAGAYAEGFPTEAEISRLFGVSRSVTREAMKMLTAKGLLSARPRQGTMVQPYDSWKLFDPDVLRWAMATDRPGPLLRHFTKLRLAIEPEAAALAAEVRDDGTVAALAAALERMRLAEQGQGVALDADISFHLAVLDGSRNPFFIQFRQLIATALRTSIRVTNRAQGRTGDVAAHGRVAEAIASGQPARASTSMRSIIEDVARLLEQPPS